MSDLAHVHWATLVMGGENPMKPIACQPDDAHRHHDCVPRNHGGRSAWLIGVLILMVYLIFATMRYVLPPRLQ
jgi:hypothetical protein